jgi:hypothetical protein
MKKARRISTEEHGSRWHEDFTLWREGDLSLMRRILPLVVLVIGGWTGIAAAQETTNPIRYTWIVSSCEKWNCAAAALVMADGEPGVIVMPTGQEARPWLILRRVEEGSVFIPEDEPYSCEVFDSVTTAGTAYTAMDGCHSPLMLSVPDGRAVVASLAKCDGGARRRSAAH